MKRTKKYNPKNHSINFNLVYEAISQSSLVGEEAKERLEIGIRSALLAFTNGVATKQHFDTLASTVDLTVMASATLFDNAYMDDIQNARQAMIRCRERFIKTGKMGLDGEGLTAIKQIIEIHNELINHVTGGEVLKFLQVRDQHIKSGNFYRSNGEIRIRA